MSINCKIIKVWNQLLGIRTSNSLNLFMDNLRDHELPITVLTESLMHFYFCYTMYLWVMLSTIGQYSIDITIKYTFSVMGYTIEAVVACNWAHVF